MSPSRPVAALVRDRHGRTYCRRLAFAVKNTGSRRGQRHPPYTERKQKKNRMIDFLVYRLAPALLLGLIVALLLPQTSGTLIRLAGHWIYGY